MLKSVNLKQFRAIVLDEHYEKVIRSIGELGLVHFTDLSEKTEEYGEFVSEIKYSDLYYKLTSLTSRMEILINKLDPQLPKGEK